ncbi:MAG: hypothetical protein GIKADHBN_01280 [Phycisphaerales bacterium]|nr:hypothetical protein [Phycisphaerales bacterium]
MAVLGITIMLLGTALSCWATSLVVRALAERAELRARRRNARSRTAQGGRDADTARREISPARGWVTLLCSPVVFVLALAATWVGVATAFSYDLPDWLSRVGNVQLIVSLAMLQVAGMVLAVGWWYDRSAGRRRCPSCWYDMVGVPGLQCPECGKAAGSERRLGRTRRHRGLILAGMVLIAAVYPLFKWKEVRKTGGFALVPTTLLIATFEYWPEDAIIKRGQQGWPGNLDSRDKFKWQERWLKSRAETLIEHARNLPAMTTAMELTTPVWRDHRFDRVVGVVFSQLASPIQAERSLAAAVAMNMGIPETCHPRYDAIAQRHAPAVANSLLDSDGNVRWMASLVVSYSKDAGNPHIPALIDTIMRDSSPGRDTARSSLAILMRLSQRSAEACEALMECLRSPDPYLRALTIHHLAFAIEEEMVSSAVVWDLLVDPSDLVSSKAAYYVTLWHSRGGIVDERAVHAILDQVDRRLLHHERFFWAVENALRAADHDPARVPGSALSRLTRLIADSDRPWYTRFAAAQSFHLSGLSCDDVVDSIRELLRDRVLPPNEQASLESAMPWLVERAEKARTGRSE